MPNQAGEQRSVRGGSLVPHSGFDIGRWRLVAGESRRNARVPTNSPVLGDAVAACTLDRQGFANSVLVQIEIVHEVVAI